ncbi:MAG: L-ribulose-5-phosphate 4-epimerase AraD [Armatimonadetes bacterium]|nr:L-ribulose-5-phosphate 4-epimerase AraD [Armatimonadota bacterium]
MLEELKHEVWEANLALHRSGLVLLTWGNVSGLDADAGVFAIKPSGVSYAELRPEQMVLVDLDGRVVEGTLRPSSDTPTHRVLYRELKGLRGVAHTHSTYATAWAQACRGLPCYGTTHADTFRGTVPVTAPLDDRALAGDYEWETGRAIVRAFAETSPAEVPGVLVANHGPFTWGGSAAQAVENSIVLEQVALLALLTEGLAPGLGPIRAPLLDKHFLRKHGASAYYGQQPTMQ